MIILDTHVWIWYVSESDKLSIKALNAIKKADSCGISTISCWEIAMLVEKNRIALTLPIESWLKLAIDQYNIQLIPLFPEISINAAKLGSEFHGDPADRIITATALYTNSILITKDKHIRDSKLIKTIW